MYILRHIIVARQIIPRLVMWSGGKRSQKVLAGHRRLRHQRLYLLIRPWNLWTCLVIGNLQAHEYIAGRQSRW